MRDSSGENLTATSMMMSPRGIGIEQPLASGEQPKADSPSDSPDPVAIFFPSVETSIECTHPTVVFVQLGYFGEVLRIPHRHQLNIPHTSPMLRTRVAAPRIHWRCHLAIFYPPTSNLLFLPTAHDVLPQSSRPSSHDTSTKYVS